VSAREDRRDRRRLKPKSHPYKKEQFNANKYYQRPVETKQADDVSIPEEDLEELWQNGT
jgi:hypothetical protein